MPDVQVCPLTVRGRWGFHDWPCVRAAGHEGECYTHPEADTYATPLDEQDKGWLVSELRLQLSRNKTDLARASETTRFYSERHVSAMDALYRVLVPNGKRKTIDAGTIWDIWRNHAS